MTVTYFVSWFLLMAPLVMSPGPANLVFAASGAKFGVRNSVALLVGVDLTFVLYSIIFGFGLGYFLQENAFIYSAVKILGVGYLLYLTYKFVKSPMIHQAANGDKTQDRYTFMDGVILNATNPKAWAMLITMFAVFVDGSFDETLQIWLLVAWLFVLNVLTHFLWIYMGSQLVTLLVDARYEFLIRVLFGGCMLAVVVWLLLE